MSTLFLGLVLCFLVVITHASHSVGKKKCKSRIVVTQSSNDIIPVVFGTLIPRVISWYIGSYLNEEVPSDTTICSLQPPAISSASCVLEGLSPTLTQDDYYSYGDQFGNELLDDQFPVVFNCDGTILINQLPDGMKKIDDECYGN